MSKLKIGNILKSLVAKFGAGENTIQVNEERNEITLSGEQHAHIEEELGRLEAADADVVRLTSEVEALGGQVISANEQIETLTGTIAALEEQVTALGEQPGTMGVKLQKEKDETGGDSLANSTSWAKEALAEIELINGK